MTQSTDEFKPKPVRRRGAARRRAILDAAAAVFLEKGYERASVAEIVANAGGSKSFLYDQFRDKAGLFEAMMIERCEEILEPLEEEIQEINDLRNALTNLGRQFVKVLRSDDAVALQRIVFSEGARNPDIADIFFDRGHDVAYDRLGAFLAQVTDNPVKSEEYRRWAVLFFAMLQGDATDRHLAAARKQPSNDEIDAQIKLAADWLFGMIRSQAS